MTSDLVTAISELAEIPESSHHVLIQALERMKGPDATAASRLRELVPNARFRALAERLARAWAIEAPALDGAAMALAVNAARESRRSAEAETQVQLAWTGPSTPEVPVRRTDQALLHLIGGATRDLWIVCFAVYKVPEVFQAIDAAAKRGVGVSLVLESAEHSEGKLSFDMIDELRSRVSASIRFFVWPHERRHRGEDGKTGVLHAKCAVADERQLFVSSANLTEHGLNRNMELGVLIGSEVAAGRVARHLRGLVELGVLEEP